VRPSCLYVSAFRTRTGDSGIMRMGGPAAKADTGELTTPNATQVITEHSRTSPNIADVSAKVSATHRGPWLRRRR
jgi:hypothetical protein